MSSLFYILLLLVMFSCEPAPTGNPYSDESGSSGDVSDNSDGESGSDEDSSSDDDSSDTYDDPGDVTATSIAALKSLYKGSTTRITTPISISGVVVANDIRGEFEDILVVDDGSDAIQISLSNDPLYYNYPLGSTIVCQCEDLYIGSDYNVLRLGIEPSTDEVVGVIEGDQLRKIYFSGDASAPIPEVVKVEDLTTRLISRFVRFESLTFMVSGENFCDINIDTGRSISTSHILADRWGNQLRLFVPYSVDYADMETPDGWFNLNAILEPTYNGAYTVRQIDYGIDMCE